VYVNIFLWSVNALLMHTLSAYIFQVGIDQQCMAEHVGLMWGLHAGAAVKFQRVELDIWR